MVSGAAAADGFHGVSLSMPSPTERERVNPHPRAPCAVQPTDDSAGLQTSSACPSSWLTDSCTASFKVNTASMLLTTVDEGIGTVESQASGFRSRTSLHKPCRMADTRSTRVYYKAQGGKLTLHHHSTILYLFNLRQPFVECTERTCMSLCSQFSAAEVRAGHPQVLLHLFV